MKMPDKVYVKKEKNNVVYSLSLQRDNGSVEYLRKNIVDETIKTAEDHAYFAGHQMMMYSGRKGMHTNK